MTERSALKPTGSARIPAIKLVVSEDFDMRSAARLNTMIEEALALQPDRLTIDLTDCPFLDAAGINVLLTAHRRAVSSGAKITLRGPSERLRRNLRLARVDGVLDTVLPDGSMERCP